MPTLEIGSISQVSQLDQKQRDQARNCGLKFDGNVYEWRSECFVRARTPSAFQAFKELFSHRVRDRNGWSRANRLTEQLTIASAQGLPTPVPYEHSNSSLKKAMQDTQKTREQVQKREDVLANAQPLQRKANDQEPRVNGKRDEVDPAKGHLSFYEGRGGNGQASYPVPGRMLDEGTPVQRIQTFNELLAASDSLLPAQQKTFLCMLGE
ncbi:hypothetical protein, partial [Paraburkholderia sediminicola]|uniref:hypothetical protein n=1 Tax=Paraburkholderia sediminicola TaxID=458836 RepID=UPI0038BBC9AF